MKAHSKLNHKKDDKVNTLLKKYHFDKIYSKKEIEEMEFDKKRKQGAIERCLLMYEDGKIKNEINKIMYHKNEEIKAQSELSVCTWKPKINKKINKGGENQRLYYNNTKIHDRFINWKEKKQHKMGRSRSIAKDEFTYKPAINDIDVKEIFSNELCFNKAESKFIYRLNKARIDEDEKKKRIEKIRNQ